MKFTLTGSLGNISKPLTAILVKAGHDVTLISSDPGKQAAIEALGARAAIGSVTDAAFLTQAFAGADAIYTMVPPNFGVSDYRQYIGETGKVYAEAIQASGVKKVVNLSSIGAHLDGGTGPISGLHDVEQTMSTLEGVSVKHLRAGFFYVNFFHDIPMIKNAGIMGSNYDSTSRLVMVHPVDIATAAAQELQGDFSGKSYRYVISDERSPAGVVQVLGKAIDQPGLPWVSFTDEEAYNGMTQAGMPAPVAKAYREMGAAVRSGILWEDYDQNKPAHTGKIRLEDFAAEFAEAYRG